MALEILICYAREDDTLRSELEKHLKVLWREGLIDIWNDRNINAGANWHNEIDKHLNKADIILLLISHNFISSDYCYSTEMDCALKRHREENVKVIPVILRHVNWQNTPLGELQALPENAKPITSWSDRNQAFLSVEKGVRNVVGELTRNHTSRTAAQNRNTSKKQADRSTTTKKSKRSNISSTQIEEPLPAEPAFFMPEQSASQVMLETASQETNNKNNHWINLKWPILILSIFNILLLLTSIFLPINSPIGQVGMILSALIFIFGYSQTILLKQWYWFLGILLLNPLTAFLFNIFDPTPLPIKWHVFILILLLSPLIGIFYALIGEKEKSHHLNNFKPVILITSTIGVVMLVIGLSVPIYWAIDACIGLILTGWGFTIFQLIRLKQDSWVIGSIILSIMIFPLIPLIGIVYVIIGPTEKKSFWYE